MDLLNFMIKNFGSLNLMMERAGMSEMDIYDRTRDIFLYFTCRMTQSRRRSDGIHLLKPSDTSPRRI